MSPATAGGAAPDKEGIRRRILDAGVHRVGFARADAAPYAAEFDAWLSRGYHADMDYLARNAARRRDPAAVLPGARTVVAVSLFYPGGSPAAPGPDAGGGAAVIASYARGEDYHRVLERRLRSVCAGLASEFSSERFRYYVDTGPVLERGWAERAGLGWIGKNCCAIDPERGSYFFIGVILSTLALEPDGPAVDHCGSCRACLDACPTQAFVGPRVLDSRLCLSYQTIENRGAIPEPLREAMGSLVFGCDVCQEVCPFNKPHPERPPPPRDPELAPREENAGPSLESLASLRDAPSFRERFPRSAVRRARWRGFRRNLAIAIGNSSRPELRALLERLRAGAAAEREDTGETEGDAVLDDALRWAEARLSQGNKKTAPSESAVRAADAGDPKGI